MQLHLTKKSKDGAIYEKDTEERSFFYPRLLSGYKQVVSKIKNMLAFLHL